MTDIDYVTMIL